MTPEDVRIEHWVRSVLALILKDADQRLQLRLTMIDEPTGGLTLWVEREDVPTMAEAHA